MLCDVFATPILIGTHVAGLLGTHNADHSTVQIGAVSTWLTNAVFLFITCNVSHVAVQTALVNVEQDMKP